MLRDKHKIGARNKVIVKLTGKVCGEVPIATVKAKGVHKLTGV